MPRGRGAYLAPVLHRQLDKLHAFFQRPGVTPGRVAPWVGLGILLPAFFIGSQLEPVGQGRAAYEEPTTIVTGAGSTGTAAPATATSIAATAADSSTPADGGGGAGASNTAADTTASDATAAGTGYVEPSAPAGNTAAADDTSDTLPADAEQYEGVVVHLNAAASSYTLATAEQDLIAVHADKQPKLGAELNAAVQPLANGTYGQAAEPTKNGSATSASFRGWITWIAPEPGLTYTVSSRGVSMLVTRPEGAAAPPPLGTPVAVTADIDLDSGTLTQTDVKTEGERTDTPVHLAGLVQAVDTTARTVTIGADDMRASEVDIVLAAPDTAIDLSKVAPDQSIDATAVIGADGSFTLTGFSDDGGRDAADDADRAQGDQVTQENPKLMARSVDRMLRALGIY